MQALLRGLWFSIFVFVVASSPIDAAPNVNEENVYYNIQGTTAKDLRTQMNKFGVRENGGKTYDGYTNWHVNWNYLCKNNRTGCWINSVKTTVRIKYTFPKWVDRSIAPPELRQKWDEFVAALVKHERRHRDIAVEAAVQIERAIAGMRPRTTCGELERHANALGRRLLDDCRKRQSECDARTHQGRLEGARFA